VRDRILGEDEVRSFCARPCLGITLAAHAPFILLTATRRDEAADMRWAELEEDEGGGGDIWLIPAARYKTSEFRGSALEGCTSGLACEAGPDQARDRGLLFTTNVTPDYGFSNGKHTLTGHVGGRRKSPRRYGDDADIVVPRWTTTTAPHGAVLDV